MSGVDAIREARDKGCHYLLQHFHCDGSFGDGTVGDYYKVPAALQVCGKTQAAHRLLDWVRHKGMTADGDFGPRTDFTDGYYYAYFNIWIVIGAARLGQFDIACRGMDFLVDFYDPESGGFYSHLSERRPDTLAGPMGDQRLWPGGSLHGSFRHSSRSWSLDAEDDGGTAELPRNAVHGHDAGAGSGDRSRPMRPDSLPARQRSRRSSVLFPPWHCWRFPITVVPGYRR